MSKFLICDGNSMFCRAYYSPMKDNLCTSDGKVTKATYIFINSLLSLIRQIHPEYIVIAFDTDHYTFRYKIYNDYKGTRDRTPKPYFLEQLNDVKEILKAINIKYVNVQGFEADDIVGTYSTLSKYQNIVFSSDKDLYQLINSHTEIYAPQTSMIHYKTINNEKFNILYDGITTEQYKELKAIMGDGSDNIIGIKGIGIKTGLKLLKKYGSVLEIYNHHDELKDTFAKKFLDFKDKFELNKKLVTIKTDIKVPYSVEDCQNKMNLSNGIKLFRQLQFNKILKEINIDNSFNEWDDL